MGRVLACADIHGMWPLWEGIKNSLKENDVLYVLGDSIDRGLDGIKIMKDMLTDPRVIYLKGNHEDMMHEVMMEYFQDDMSGLQWWFSNGGLPTYDAFIAESKVMQTWLLHKIKQMPEVEIYENKEGKTIILCHAGTHLGYTEKQEEEEIRKCGGRSMMLWDRDHFWYEWPPAEEFKETYIVHGHTPCPILTYEMNIKRQLQRQAKIPYEEVDVIQYSNGHKIDIDLASFNTGVAALFNLDTLEVEEYFIMKVEKNDK